MKLYYTQTSPFVRKALVVANEAGIANKLDKIDCSPTTPINPDAAIANPLKKIPALELDDGTILFDSPVVCEYLDAELGDGTIFPKDSSARWTALRFQALADGLRDGDRARGRQAAVVHARAGDDVGDHRRPQSRDRQRSGRP